MVTVINGFLARSTSVYVLINCELGCQIAVIDELLTLPQVMEAYEIYCSVYDIIILLRRMKLN
jgi:hypothetical protein